MSGLETFLYAADPAFFVQRALGFQLDRHQCAVLTTPARRIILNCSRQWGKSTVTALRAIHRAVNFPASEILVASPSERQSSEFLRKASIFMTRLGYTPRSDSFNKRSLQFPNGSRIVGLPCSEATTRGFSGVHLLIIDEAAQVPDQFYRSLRPTCSTTNGDIWLVSTPFGQRGFFWHSFTHEQDRWFRLSVPAPECPRIHPAFLEEERATLPERVFRQEYLCAFTTTEDAVFPEELIQRAITASLQPFIPHTKQPYYQPVR